MLKITIIQVIRNPRHTIFSNSVQKLSHREEKKKRGHTTSEIRHPPLKTYSPRQNCKFCRGQKVSAMVETTCIHSLESFSTAYLRDIGRIRFGASLRSRYNGRSEGLIDGHVNFGDDGIHDVNARQRRDFSQRHDLVRLR